MQAAQQLVSLRLLVEILLGASALVGIGWEIYSGTVRETVRAITSMPEDLDTKVEQLSENQEEMIDGQADLDERMDSVEMGLEALGYAINEDRQVDLDGLQDSLGAEERPDDFLRGGVDGGDFSGSDPQGGGMNDGNRGIDD